MIKILLFLLTGMSVPADLATDSIYAMIRGQRTSIAVKEIERIEPLRDLTGNVTWPIPGYQNAKLTFADASDTTVAVENLRFGDLSLAELKSVVFRGASDVNLAYDRLLLRDKTELQGDILNQIFEVKLFYPTPGEPTVLRFSKEQLRRIEFGDAPLQTEVDTSPSPLFPQKTRVPVRSRFDKIILRNGDRLTGELQSAGLDFRPAPDPNTVARPGALRPGDPKLGDAKSLETVRKLIPLADIRSIDFSSR